MFRELRARDLSFMISRLHTVLILFAVFCLHVIPASAGEIRIRLVDEATQMPLEFWQKTTEQPDLGQHALLADAEASCVDGHVWPFARYGGREGRSAAHARERPGRGC